MILTEILIFIAVIATIVISGLYGYRCGEKAGFERGRRITQAIYTSKLRDRNEEEKERFEQYMRLP